MNLNTLLEKYQTLLPWNLARTKCFVNIYAQAILKIGQLKGSLSLALDLTNWKFGRIYTNLLVLAVVITDQFSIPLFWKALPKKGNSNTEERIDMLQFFIDIFGPQRIASLTADREFIGKTWIDYLIKNQIPFFIRIKENRLVE
jgi:hypothetical protein